MVARPLVSKPPYVAMKCETGPCVCAIRVEEYIPALAIEMSFLSPSLFYIE
jgi:hypothetical protein